MTDIVFITTTEKLDIKYEIHGTMILATKLLGEGFSTSLLRFGQFESYNKDYDRFIQDVVARVMSIRPKCVSFYTLWPYYHIMLRISREIKALYPECYIILGGPQASATAQATMEAIDCVDYICSGEGEHTVVPFFTALLRKENKDFSEIPGLYYRENGVIKHNELLKELCNIDDIPYWNSSLYLNDYDPHQADLTSATYYMPIEVGRGCPFSCTFCSASKIWNRKYRLKSPDKVIEDIRYYKENFGIRSFMFSHDAFTVNKRKVIELCDRFIEEKLNVTWKCTSRIDCVDEELILKMKEAGMTGIEFGIETGSPSMQKIINKKLDLSRAKRIISFLLKQKIHTSLFFMYGFPEETEEDLNQTITFQFDAIDLGVNYSNMNYCRFNPQSAITDQHMDSLVYSRDIKIMAQSVAFGYYAEEAMIQKHKDIFPFFYHLNTPIRNDYQFARYLTRLYKRFPYFMKQIRNYYGGDNLSFYRDLLRYNAPVFEHDMPYISNALNNDPYPLLKNLLDAIEIKNKTQLNAILLFEIAVRDIRRSECDVEIIQQFDFSYYEYKLNLPSDAFTPVKTTLKIQNINKRLGIQIIGIE